MKIFCVSCKRETNHSVKFEYKKRFDDVENSINYFDNWQIVECNGCEGVSFRKESFNSDDIHPETGEPYKYITIFPIRGEGEDVLPIKYYYNAPWKLRGIYREMIDAYNNGMPLLCAGGLRATLEGICNSNNIKNGPIPFIDKAGKTITKRKKDLMGKISGLQEKGIVTETNAKILQEHRFLGNDALHTLETPSKEELKIAIEIIEHTLDDLYEISHKAAELKAKRENRKTKK